MQIGIGQLSARNVRAVNYDALGIPASEKIPLLAATFENRDNLTLMNRPPRSFRPTRFASPE